MASYVYGNNWSYKDFLQAKEFHDSVTMTIETQTLKQIATAEELARDGAIILREALESSTEQIVDAVCDHAELTAKGFTILQYGLKQVETAVSGVHSAIRDQTALLDWRLSEVVGELGEINTDLNTLIKLARTPSQTWAYEQFDIAREAFNRGLFKEALTALEHATNGFESHTGYPLEPRFHYLSGTIYLTARSEDEDFIDFAAAEKAFNRSAKIAGERSPKMASRSLCAAGYAAFRQGAIERARTCLDEAKSLCSDNAEAFFLSGKLYAHSGSVELAIDDLVVAIKVDRRYALRAGNDEDYQKYSNIIDNAEARIIEKVQEMVIKSIDIASSELKQLQKISSSVEQMIAQTPCLASNFDVKKSHFLLNASEVKQVLEEVGKVSQRGTLFGITNSQIPALKLNKGLKKAKAQLADQFNNIKNKIESVAAETIRNKDSERKAAVIPAPPSCQKIDKSEKFGLIILVPIYIIALLLASMAAYDKKGIGEAVLIFISGGVISPIIVFPASMLLGLMHYAFVKGNHELVVQNYNERIRKLNEDINHNNAKIDTAINKIKLEKQVLLNVISKGEAALNIFETQTDEALHFSTIGLNATGDEPWTTTAT